MDTQLFVGRYYPKSAMILPTKNQMFVKPNGGLWTSTYQDGSSDWIRWCTPRQMDWIQDRRWFLLTPDHDARVLVIDSLRDLVDLYELYEFDAGYKSLNPLDFESIARNYDAIHLTDKGQSETELSFPKNLYGWDCESTVWLRWKFTSVEEIEPVL